MINAEPRVLLIGHRMSWGWSVIATLEQLGCKLSFLTAEESSSPSARLASFDVILGSSNCNHRFHRSPSLAGSRTTVFYLYPVEDGCWWLPALRLGVDCYGSPALRPSELALYLKQMLRPTAAPSLKKQNSAA